MKYVKWGEKSQPISTSYVRIQQHCYTNAIPQYRNLSTGFMLQTGELGTRQILGKCWFSSRSFIIMPISFSKLTFSSDTISGMMWSRVQVSFLYFIVANYRFDSTSFTGKFVSFIALRCHSSYKAKILVCVRGSVISELSSWFSLLFFPAPISTVWISTALKYVLIPGKSNSSNCFSPSKLPWLCLVICKFVWILEWPFPLTHTYSLWWSF